MSRHGVTLNPTRLVDSVHVCPAPLCRGSDSRADSGDPTVVPHQQSARFIAPRTLGPQSDKHETSREAVSLARA